MLITKFTTYDMTKCYHVYLKDGEIDHLQLFFTSEQIRVAKCIAYQILHYSQVMSASYNYIINLMVMT